MMFTTLALVGAAWAQDNGTLLESARADFVCVSPQARTPPLSGVPPLVVTCVVVLSDLFTYDEAFWRFGDGSEAWGDSVSHIYEVEGQFGVTLELEGMRYVVDDTGPAAVVEPEITKYGEVTACGVPFAEFRIEKRAGLLYEVFNRSDFLPGCVDEVLWTVHRGSDRSGAVVFEATGWEPSIELPDDGTYSFFLDLYGPAGGGAAKLTIDAKYGVDERLQGSRRWGCDTTSASSGLLGLLLVGGLARRRSAGCR